MRRSTGQGEPHRRSHDCCPEIPCHCMRIALHKRFEGLHSYDLAKLITSNPNVHLCKQARHVGDAAALSRPLEVEQILAPCTFDCKTSNPASILCLLLPILLQEALEIPFKGDQSSCRFCGASLAPKGPTIALSHWNSLQNQKLPA